MGGHPAQGPESLDGISAALHRAGAQYSEVEQANTGMFRAG